MSAHVELIDPSEKLEASLGGTGYCAPGTAATRRQLLASLDRADVGMVVWKVTRRSVTWSRSRPVGDRRLPIHGHRIPCWILGSSFQWWFISVNALAARRILEKATW